MLFNPTFVKSNNSDDFGCFMSVYWTQYVCCVAIMYYRITHAIYIGYYNMKIATCRKLAVRLYNAVCMVKTQSKFYLQLRRTATEVNEHRLFFIADGNIRIFLATVRGGERI